MQIARQEQPGLVHHVVSRFVDKQWFLADDVERAKYLDYLGKALTKSDWRCLAYAIMSSHLHLAMLAGQTTAERWTRRVHPPFASWMNKRHGRLGPMFAKRSDMWIVREANVGRLLAYLHNNPVRGSVVSCARDSSWTSHRAYIGVVRAPDWLCVHEGLAYSGTTIETFDAYVNADVGAPLESVPLQGIHREVRKRGAIELGTPVAGATAKVPLVVRRGTYVRPEPSVVMDAVCAVLGVDRNALRSRQRSATDARAVTMLVAASLGISYSQMAAALGMSAATGSRLAGRVLGAAETAAVELSLRRIQR